MTSIHTEVASSSSEEATRGALDSALHPLDDEHECTDGYSEQSGPRGDNRVGDMIIASASCDVKESLDPAATDHSCARLRVPSPCISFPAAPEPPYPPFPRYSSTTDTASPGNPPQMGSLVFKRLRREMDSPSPRHYKMMIACMLSVMFLSGWNDASTGPLLPTLQKYYHLDYLSVGYIWVCNFVGFLIAGLANVYIVDRFGFGIAAPFAAFVQAIGYSFMMTGGPYPLFLTAFILNGFGMGFLDALVSGLTARLPNATTRTFLNYASYSFGAMISPLVSTQFVKSARTNTFLYYAVSLAFGLVNVVLLLSIFRLRTAEQIVGRPVLETIPHTHLASTVATAGHEKQLDAIAHAQGPMPSPDPEAPPMCIESADHACKTSAKMRKMFSSPLLHCLAFYSALYVGGEFTITGWAATYLQQERGGGVDVGYVSTGHFAGVTIGRLVLIPVANHMGKHNMVIFFTLISIALLVIIWVIPSLILSAVAFSILGFFLSPFWPILIMVIVDVLPVEIQSGSIGWVASLGCAGSALMPFITASVSNKYGIWILQPLLIAIFSLSLVLWVFVPRPRKWRA